MRRSAHPGNPNSATSISADRANRESRFLSRWLAPHRHRLAGLVCHRGRCCNGCGGGSSSGGSGGGGGSTQTPDMGTLTTVSDSYEYSLENAASSLVLGIAGQSQTAAHRRCAGVGHRLGRLPLAFHAHEQQPVQYREHAHPSSHGRSERISRRPGRRFCNGPTAEPTITFGSSIFLRTETISSRMSTADSILKMPIPAPHPPRPSIRTHARPAGRAAPARNGCSPQITHRPTQLLSRSTSHTRPPTHPPSASMIHPC